MKLFFSRNIKLFFCLLFFFFIILIFHIYALISRDSEPEVVLDYDSIREKDIIPFNSVINGYFNMNIEFISKENDYVYYQTNNRLNFNFINVYYCKTSSCLTTEEYDAANALYNVGDNSYFSYKVLSYNDIFHNNSKYTAWQLHLLPFKFSSDYLEHYIGTYYDIVLVPTTLDENECIEEKKFVYYGKTNSYKVNNIDSSWKNDDEVYKISNNESGTLEFKFNASKGDRVLFDIKTNSRTLKIFLNDDEINDIVGFKPFEEQYNSSFRYNNKILDIKETGDYTLRFDQAIIEDKYNVRYNSFVNIKNLIIFTPTKKEDSNIYYTMCDSDILVRNSDDL